MTQDTTADRPSANDRAIDALLRLLALRKWSDIALFDIANEAGMTLAELRKVAPSKGAVLAGFARRVDMQVLANPDESAALAAEPARERLFDVVMRRLDALATHKAAVRSAREGLLRDPLAASAWNKVEVNSAQWMLAAADIPESGPFGGLKAQALAILFARVLDTWLDDDDPGLARTMRALDDELRQAERLARTAERLEGFVAPLGRICETLARPLLCRSRRIRRDEAPATAAADPEDYVPAI